MKARWATAVAVVLSFHAPAFAHRLDEYLQATLFSVENNRLHASMRLIPGVSVASSVLAIVDSNADGVISTVEQRAYAERVLSDLSLSADGERLQPCVISVEFPKIVELKDGLGEIQIEFSAELRPGNSHRQIVFENRHQPGRSVYLANVLVPQDHAIQIISQIRNRDQSIYRLDYTQAAGVESSIGNPGVMPAMFRLGMRHIAEGTDHLLFLLTLLLPAPLLVFRARWAGFAGIRHSVLQILKVVSAFTIGHSLTLALAALGLVHVPTRPIEVLVAFSILVSAVHAVRPLFPGREAVVAALFGLMHGLAFAATLQNLQLPWWPRVLSILGFNLGIEAMQLIVVCAILPSLVLLSRTRAYSLFRLPGALFAMSASTGWIAERLWDIHSSVDAIVDALAHRALWIAAALFAVSVVCWAWSTRRRLLRSAEINANCVVGPSPLAVTRLHSSWKSSPQGRA